MKRDRRDSDRQKYQEDFREPTAGTKTYTVLRNVAFFLCGDLHLIFEHAETFFNA